MLPFDRYSKGGYELLEMPKVSTESCRRGYGLPTFEQCGLCCAYCGRDMGASFESWLSISVDHVVPFATVRACEYPMEWVDNLANKVTCCRACNEFLNAFKVSEPPPEDLDAFFELRDRVFRQKREWVRRRRELEKQWYTKWREAGAPGLPPALHGGR